MHIHKPSREKNIVFLLVLFTAWVSPIDFNTTAIESKLCWTCVNCTSRSTGEFRKWHQSIQSIHQHIYGIALHTTRGFMKHHRSLFSPLFQISPHIKCKRPTYPLYFQLISHRHNFFCTLVKAELTKFYMSY